MPEQSEWGGPEPSHPEIIVSVDHVTKSFGDKLALSDMSFDIPGGQICGLLGPNGAGKTTLFRLLMGILKASAGTLRIAGLDAFEDRVATKRLIGFLPDEPVFYSYLSGRELLELSATSIWSGTSSRRATVMASTACLLAT
jgi:ABC-type multidrug transport system ATPase subunit